MLAIIPARKGSKRLPNKNILPINGKPMVEYTIEEAKKSSYINHIVVTTNDERVKRIARKHKVDIINRPEELSKDDTTSEEVIKHVLKTYGDDMSILYLQPTSPLRTSEDIDSAIEEYLMNYNPEKPETLITVRSIHPFNIYVPNGSIFIIPRDKFLKEGKIYGSYIRLMVMSDEKSIDIDTEFDLKIAELLCKQISH